MSFINEWDMKRLQDSLKASIFYQDEKSPKIRFDWTVFLTVPNSAISFAVRFVAAVTSGKFIYFPTPEPYFFGFGICVITAGALTTVSEI